MLLKNKNVIKIKRKNIKRLRYLEKKFKFLNINIPGDPSSAAFFTALSVTNQKIILDY